MAAISSKVSSAKTMRAVAVRPVTARRSVTVCAKYGEDSKYFDSKDMSNSAGAWDMYGDDNKKRYPAMQEEFFNRAGDILSRREALRGFLALAGVGAAVIYGFKGAKEAKLPITVGPKTTGENGKGGTITSKL